MKRFPGVVFFLVFEVLAMAASTTEQAFDMDKAREICDQSPLESVEGIWIYPDDNVTVLILHRDDVNENQFPQYDISVVKTTDVRIRPGEVIGSLTATPDKDIYKIELATESKNDYLLKPKSVLATLNKDRDALIIKKQKVPFKGRLNFNFNRLLPGFWKIVSMGISQRENNNTAQPPVGMVKIYPSYDGNGSSRRKVRYL